MSGKKRMRKSHDLASTKTRNEFVAAEAALGHAHLVHVAALPDARTVQRSLAFAVPAVRKGRARPAAKFFAEGLVAGGDSELADAREKTWGLRGGRLRW